MASVFGNRHGVFWSTSCNGGTTINAEAYCLTLREISRAIKKQNKKILGILTKEIVLLQDDARPDTAGQTRNLLDSFGWEVLDHPQYSRDLAPNDYHPFLHLKQHLRGKRYNDDDDVKTESQKQILNTN